MGRMIGIDLGTTNSCVCVIDHDERVVIPNAEGARTTPSMVAFTESGERLVGQIAKRQSVTNPTNTIYAVKRLIGRGFDSPEVSAFRKTTPYKIVKGPGDRAVIEAGGKSIEPVEISAMVLAKMKEIAQDYLNAEVTDAVVTVPAYFNDSQRQSTKDAGRIAGLNVQRIINEPTAAALAYGLGSAVHETVAVFDLGGGTFDVSILEIGDGVFQVKSTHGDTYLGGEDWDRRIVDHLADEFMKENKVDLRGDPMALQRLKEASEKAKHELSTTTETDINLPFITADASGPKHLSTSINRATLEAITADLIERLEAPCREAMADAGLKPENIDKVLLVGGMTRMPKVQEKVASIFGKKPAKGVNPDEVVAIGAAIQGSVLEGETEDVVLLDVTPLSLGIETMGGIFTRLIDRNTSIPVKRSEVFSTTQDNQSVVNVHVLQGERELAQDNMSLSRFQLVGLPPAPRGVPQIEVTFSIDANGIVHVSAKDLGTGKEQSVRIQVSSGLNEEAVNRMIAEGDNYKEEDRKRKALVQMRNDAEGLLYTTRKALEEFGTSLTLDQKDEASALADNLEKSLDTENIDQIKKAFEKLSTASQKLTQAIYQQSSK